MAEGEIGRDRDDSLPSVERAPSYPTSADYLGGGSSNYSTSVQHSYKNTAHIHVLGKKKHSWDQKG